jgi:hypothetical protein
VARLQRIAHPGDHVVLQLDRSYHLRDCLTDDDLSVLFTSLPDYYRTQSLAGRVAWARMVPAPALWAACHPRDVEVPAVLSPAQQLDLASIEGPSFHVADDTAQPLAEGVAGQGCDSYLFGAALKQGPLRPSPLFCAAMGSDGRVLVAFIRQIEVVATAQAGG